MNTKFDDLMREYTKEELVQFTIDGFTDGQVTLGLTMVAFGLLGFDEDEGLAMLKRAAPDVLQDVPITIH